MKIRKITKLTFGAAIIGLVIFGVGRLQTEAQQEAAQPAQAAPPVTDCFESREQYTAITRIENVVPEYGYPSFKCSQTTGGVLWWGDPYFSTAPMGEMPLFGPEDKTRGDYETEEAVVRPREPMLMYFNMDPDKHCQMCHDGKQVPFPKDKKQRPLAMHVPDIVEDATKLMHGRGALWCLDCHNPTERNNLYDHNGNNISFNQPQKLCGKCHGEVYIDWRMGIHGKRSGSWMKGGKKRWWVCTECHNPHTVQINRFQPFKPEPAPALPKGMKNAAHEQHHGGGHGDTAGHGAASGHGEAAPAKH